VLEHVWTAEIVAGRANLDAAAVAMKNFGPANNTEDGHSGH